MSRFIESIRLENGRMYLPELHQQRIERSLRNFGSEIYIDILKKKFFKKLPADGLHKIRLNYGLDGKYSYVYLPYQRQVHSSFSMVRAEAIDYSFKYADRAALNQLKDGGSEILIVKNGQLTDASYANLIFYKDEKWFTPASFLLNGVQRQWLLHNHLISETEITPENLHQFSLFKLINALNPIEKAVGYPLGRIRNLLF